MIRVNTGTDLKAGNKSLVKGVFFCLTTHFLKENPFAFFSPHREGPIGVLSSPSVKSDVKSDSKSPTPETASTRVDSETTPKKFLPSGSLRVQVRFVLVLQRNSSLIGRSLFVAQRRVAQTISLANGARRRQVEKARGSW